MNRRTRQQEIAFENGDARTDLAAMPRRRRRWRSLTLSVAVFFIALEFALGALCGFSFPHLSIFRADPVYGVTLAANTTARVRTRDRHITTVRTNADGFRGERFSAAGSGRRVLVVGDSQAMGLHVDETDMLSTVLGTLLANDAHVFTAAVPTYGPHEYATLVERLVPALGIDDVIVVMAPASDHFEARIPNLKRTTAHLGFAARVTGGTASAKARAATNDVDMRWPDVLGRSHLVYTARRLARAVSDDHVLTDAPRVLATMGPRLLQSGKSGHAFRTTFARLAKVARKNDVNVVVTVLPLDVEIDDAWQKYAPGTDRSVVLSSLMALRNGVESEAVAHGLRVFDAVSPLTSEVGPHFLLDDDHLSPRGHRVLARALHRALTADLSSTAATASSFPTRIAEVSP